jgi:phospholipase C
MMGAMTRRMVRFRRSGRRSLAALASAGLLALGSCQQAAGPAPTPGARPGVFKHIIVIFQENRSFDHYFGLFVPAAGQTLDGLDPLPANACQGMPRVCASTITAETADPVHEYGAMLEEFHDGAMDRYVAVGGPKTMGHYDGESVGVLWDLARQYGLADHWFQPMFGPSTPQHLFLVAATAGGIMSGDPGQGRCTKGTASLDVPNIGDRMTAAGVSWRWYSEGLANCTNVAHHQAFQYFPSTGASPNLVDLSEFSADLQTGKLPQVSYLKSTRNSEHPPATVRRHQQWLRQTIEEVQTSPVWRDTVIILTYDESGGWYDHVPPPVVKTTANERGLGPRVPALVISPYSKRGYVSHVQYDHTSILRFIEWNFWLRPLNYRDAGANNLLDFFDFSARRSARFSEPAGLPVWVRP